MTMSMMMRTMMMMKMMEMLKMKEGSWNLLMVEPMAAGSGSGSKLWEVGININSTIATIIMIIITIIMIIIATTTIVNAQDHLHGLT